MKRVIVLTAASLIILITPLLSQAQICQTVGSDVRVSFKAGDSHRPHLAWTGSEYGVIWYDLYSVNLSEIFFARLSPSGDKIGTDLQLTDAPNSQSYPKLVWTGSEFGAAWRDARDGVSRSELYFVRVSAAGAKIGTEVRVTEDPGNSYWFSLDWTGAEYGLAWEDTRDPVNKEIYFARLSAEGIKISPDLQISFANLDSCMPSLAWTGSEYGLAWKDGRDDNYEIYFTRLAPSGAQIGGDVRLSFAAGTSCYPSVAWTGSEFGVGYIDEAPRHQPYFVRLSAEGLRLGDAIVAGQDLDADLGPPPALAWTGSAYGLVWQTNSPDFEIRFAALAADGVQRGDDLLLDNNGEWSVSPAMVWTGSDFAIVWSDSRKNNWEIYFARLGCDFTPPLPPSDFTAAAIPGTRQIQLNWLISPSPDIKEYRLYMGGAPETIDYNSLYAGVDHPTNFYATGDLVNGQQYCFGLRGVDVLGNEYSGPGLVACATPRQWCENCGTIITPPVEWRLEVTLLEASAGLSSDVYLDQPALELMLTDSINHEGQVVTSETTAVGGDPVRFFIRVHGETMGLGTYDHYSDSQYAWVNQIDYYTYVIGFEDLPEDIADWDYNDVIIQVKFVPVDLGASPASACLSSAAIKTPRPGHQFCGNRGTVMAELTADKSLVQDVKFQARPVGGEWFDLVAADAHHPNPDASSPYFIHVDISALAAGDYELRAVTTDLAGCVDPAPDSIVITVDHENCSSREGDCGSGHCKEVQVYSSAPEDVLMAMPSAGDHIVSVSLPAGGLSSATELTLSSPDCNVMAQEGDEGFGECRMIVLANGQEWLLNDAQAQLMVSYADLDDDGIVDGTTVSAKNLRIYAQDPVTLVWSPLPGYVQSNQRMVVGNTNHFSSFQLGRKLPPKPIKLALSCALAPGAAALDGAGLASLALALLIPLMIGLAVKRSSLRGQRRR